MYPKGDMTQPFGTNGALYARFGMIGHNGLDLVRPHGTPMYAIEDGICINVADERDGFGKVIRIMSTKTYNGMRREWTYAHNSKHYVQVDQRVKAGEHICDMGNTGFVVSNSTGNGFWNANPYAGTHLHLGLRYLKISTKGWSYPGSRYKIDIQDYQNGYRGAVDPTEVLQSITGEIKEDPRIPLLKQYVFLLTQYYNLLKSRK
jgi:murein DD-endopeptidase MepM/ murein hydrolase activator NlpD